MACEICNFDTKTGLGVLCGDFSCPTYRANRQVFMPVSSSSSRAYPSCFGQEERIRTADGGSVRAGDIVRLVRQGRRVALLTEAPFLGEASDAGVANPVIAAAFTEGEAYRIVFEGGREVTLTGAHRLPGGAATIHSLDFGGCPTPVRVQQHVRADEVRAGQTLLDGRVVRVDRLGSIRAVRIWTDFPAWVTTGAGLTVGTRWHETTGANGWIVSRGEMVRIPGTYSDIYVGRVALDVPDILDIEVSYDETGRTLPSGERGKVHVYQSAGPRPALEALQGMAVNLDGAEGRGAILDAAASANQMADALEGNRALRWWKPGAAGGGEALSHRPFEMLAVIRKDAAEVPIEGELALMAA